MEGYAECEICGNFRSVEFPDTIKSGDKVKWFCENCNHLSSFEFVDNRYESNVIPNNCFNLTMDNTKDVGL